MKKAILVHGWGGSPEKDWFVWMKEELEGKGWKVIAPEMPDTMKPDMVMWVEKLKKVSGEIDKDTYFIGHSIGCQAVMRYLETLPEDKKVGGVIFVAGWFNLTDTTWDDEGYTKEIANPWLTIPINFDKIKKHTSKFVDFASDNDPYVPLGDMKIFEVKLEAEVILLNDQGHFSEEDGVRELPEVLNKLIEISR